MPPLINTSTHLLHSYYHYISNSVWFSPIRSTYDTAKHSHIIVEEGLNKVETTLSSLSSYFISIIINIMNVLYVTPKEKITYLLSTGYDRVTGIINDVKNTVIKLATISLGATVLVFQCGLVITVGGTSFVLDGIDKGKKGVQMCKDTVDDANQRIRQVATNTVRIVWTPIDYSIANIHSLLDIVEGFIENRMEMLVEVSPEASILSRIYAILSSLSTGLTLRAHTKVIDPLHSQIELLIDQTKKSLIVLESVRERGYWEVEKRVSSISSSVYQLKKSIEEEANRYRVSPEDILLKGIHSSSRSLSRNLIVLKEKNSQIIGDGSILDTVIDHLSHIQYSLQETKDVYDMRDEVLLQTKQSLSSLSNTILL